jgi:hypothetical protein
MQPGTGRARARPEGIRRAGGDLLFMGNGFRVDPTCDKERVDNVNNDLKLC